MAKVTKEEAEKLLSYCAETGEFRWIVDRGNRTRAGSIAGNVGSHGYRVIEIHSTPYKAHRLAWLFETGQWPEVQIDHINGVRDDNRIANLRDVDRRTNLENQRKGQAGSAVPLLGVVRRGNSFRAVISSRGKMSWLGTFKTPEAAHEAYLKAKAEIHAGYVA